MTARHRVCADSMSSNAIATPAAREPAALSDSLAKPELARKFHDNAVRSLPEERAAEIAARTLALPDAPPTLSEADFKAWTAAPQEAAANGGEQ